MDGTRKQITHIDGKAIIEREVAQAPHPNPGQKGRMTDMTGVEHVLLEDGSETNICAECGYTNDNVRSVVAHMATHGEKSPSQYSDLVLRNIIREVLRAKKAGVRNYAEVAAASLNNMGVKPVQGEHFTPHMVSNLFRDHHERFPGIRVSALGVGKVETAKAAIRERTNDLDVVDPTQLTGPEKALVNNRVRRIDKMLGELRDELHFFDKYVRELEAKAKAYDKMKDAMRGL